MSGEEMQVPEDVYLSVVENLKIDLQNARNERDRAWAQRDEARAEVERLNECHADTVAVGKDLYHRYVQEIFRSHIWRKAAKSFRRQRDEARAEVERLRESLEWSEACRKARLSMAETCLNGRAAGKSPCGACSICCGDFKAEVTHLRAGIEAYRRAFNEFDGEYCPSDFLSRDLLEAMRKWEWKDKQRSEKV